MRVIENSIPNPIISGIVAIGMDGNGKMVFPIPVPEKNVFFPFPFFSFTGKMIPVLLNE